MDQTDITSGESDASPDGDATGSRTGETVESLTARLSGKDKAHAVAIAAKDEAYSKATSEAASLREENERLKARLEAEAKEKAALSAAARQARFPLAADTLGSDHLASMDEASLSRLEERLGAASDNGVGILSSGAQRPTGGEKPMDQKSSAELRADLARMAPEFLSDIS